MQLKTILNRVQKFKSFVYETVEFSESDGQLVLLIHIIARVRSLPICSGCNRRGPWYDTLGTRKFEFVPLWGIPVFFVYAMRRFTANDAGLRWNPSLGQTANRP